jgi:hypothetical protein
MHFFKKWHYEGKKAETLRIKVVGVLDLITVWALRA